MTFMSMAAMASSKEMNEIALIKSPQGIGNKQDQGRAQQGRQGAVHPFEGDDEVDQQQDNGGNPEGRGDLALDMEILLDLEELIAGSIRPRHHHRHGRGRQGHPGRFKGLDLHLGIRQGPRRQDKLPTKAPDLPVVIFSFSVVLTC